MEGEVLVIGDMNCKFGRDAGSRFSGITTPNARKLLRTAEACELNIIDRDDEQCDGPCYTFNVKGVGSSYIDHCMGSSLVELNVTSCRVLEDEILNTSDHLPITTTINISKRGIRDDQNEVLLSSVAEKKLTPDTIRTQYTNPINDALEHIDTMMDAIGQVKTEETETMIDSVVEELCKIVQQHCNKLPQKRYNKHLKPYWCDSLKELNRGKKDTWRQWKVSKGMENEDDNYMKYKDAKKSFAKAVKKAKKEYDLKNMEEIINSNDIDIIYFWKLVNKSKNKVKVLHPLKMEDGTVITEPNEMREAWQKYFEKLYKPDLKDNFDNEFRSFVEEKLKEYMNDANIILDDILQDEFGQDEISKAIKSMKPDKAPGWDKVTVESIRYAGDKMIKLLTKLCNIITHMEYIPWHFKIGLLIPIPKGDKNKFFQDNYRGITLLPVIAKIVEKCYMQRIDKWAKDKDIIIDIQGALQSKCSSIQSAWLVKESIAENTENDVSSYIGLLDIQKAFDTIWQNGMLYQMYQAGIKGKMWRILRLFYKNFICRVLINGKASNDIKALRGIHQGAPCSMFFFALFLNELLRKLQELYVCNTLCGITLNCIAYADDITLLARCKTDLQTLFDIAYEYSVKWHFRFNPEKCITLVFGKDRQKDMNITLGGYKIKESKSEPHLGGVLATTAAKEQEYINLRIDACQNMCYASQSLGSSSVPVTPVILSKLYHSVCLPKLCYAVETMELDPKCIDTMETFHAKNAKMFQGLPSNTCNIGSLTALGWSTISALIDIYRLLFMWRMLLLPMQCVYKVIILKRIMNQMLLTNDFKGPVNKILTACKKYGLCQIVLNGVLYGDYISQAEWKKVVKESVYKMDTKRQKVHTKVYKSMSLINDNFVGSHVISPWWIYSKTFPRQVKKCRVLIGLILNSYRLGRKRCVFCIDGHQNDIAHILFQCKKLEDTRKDLWYTVKTHCPPQLWNDINAMSPSDCCMFVLNAFNCNFVIEWKDLYRSTANYVHVMFRLYQKEVNAASMP